MPQIVNMKTNYGSIKIQLDSEKAPKTVENFLNYVNAGFYDGTLFHRVIDGFMIQGGGMEAGMQEKTTNPPIENEATNGLETIPMVLLSMARQPRTLTTASSQFFINVANNTFLNHTEKTSQGWGYCVFAEVIEGMDIVDKIKKVATTNHGHHQDVPKEDVIIEKAEVLSN
ncbi:peptidyl-prolyl cis-trans isomerase B [Beggiatoa sp. PS]|nr:peptidyl-prolyl cis-trans isomerase B [Beggiatoa sp. PS]